MNGEKNRLELIAVNKTIGKETVLRDVNLTFESGNVYVLSGENGSGKTMLLRLIAGLIFADEGSIIFNDNVQKKFGRLIYSVGLILEDDLMYERMSIKDNLKLLASINKRVSDREIDEWIQRVKLAEYGNKKLAQYSLGMKKRAMIAQSVMEKPDVILWDEPFNGLDVESKNILCDICREEKKRGAIIIISSHIQEDLSDLADEIIDVSRGEFSHA